MDATRGAAVLLVVAHHVTSVAPEFNLVVPSSVASIDRFFAPFRMPMLMFLSGLLLSASLSKPTRTYVVGKLSGIGWPYAVWTLITLVATAQLSFIAIAKTPITSPTYLWYLHFLLVFYAVAWAWNRVRLPFSLLAGAALVVSAVVPDVARLPRFFFLLGFFALGAHLASRQTFLTRRAIIVLPVGLSIAAVAAAASAGGASVRYSAIWAWGAISLCLAIVAASKWYRGSRVLKPLEAMGRGSLVYYVSHMSVVYLIFGATTRVGVASFWISGLAAALAALVAAGLLARFDAHSRLPSILFRFPRRLEPPITQRNRDQPTAGEQTTSSREDVQIRKTT
ncbi:acyltransferase family protein [Aeromicrobium senzhongii]|uniref:Acyltransferase family protein n=1 Tax=Aeromicrobium senzhongii TaxID=2663859 RepID=A0ABX6ST38_9ACTN|nr:acyltransferase family protein [Aeromicrobium senzhongii]QNL94303.1 acyltransferase family protein [Aeromicrobium senzhongii]